MNPGRGSDGGGGARGCLPQWHLKAELAPSRRCCGNRLLAPRERSTGCRVGSRTDGSNPGELVVAGSQWRHLLREKPTEPARLVPVPTDLTLGARGGRIRRRRAFVAHAQVLSSSTFGVSGRPLPPTSMFCFSRPHPRDPHPTPLLSPKPPKTIFMRGVREGGEDAEFDSD